MIKKINQNRTKKECKKPFKVAKIVLSSGDRALPPEWVDKVEGVQQAGELVRWQIEWGRGISRPHQSNMAAKILTPNISLSVTGWKNTLATQAKVPVHW